MKVEPHSGGWERWRWVRDIFDNCLVTTLRRVLNVDMLRSPGLRGPHKINPLITLAGSVSDLSYLGLVGELRVTAEVCGCAPLC